jgi:hypothetical protein
VAVTAVGLGDGRSDGQVSICEEMTINCVAATTIESARGDCSAELPGRNSYPTKDLTSNNADVIILPVRQTPYMRWLTI